MRLNLRYEIAVETFSVAQSQAEQSRFPLTMPRPPNNTDDATPTDGATADAATDDATDDATDANTVL